MNNREMESINQRVKPRAFFSYQSIQTPSNAHQNRFFFPHLGKVFLLPAELARHLPSWQHFSTVHDFFYHRIATSSWRQRIKLGFELYQWLESFSIRPQTSLFQLVSQSLQQLQTLDLIEGENSFIQSISNQNKIEAPIDRILIPTCGRSDQLLRCLKSIDRYAKEFDKKISVIISDDSKEQEHSLIRSSEAELSSLHVSIIDQKIKSKWIEELTLKGLPKSLLEFVIGVKRKSFITPGGNRNSLLLSSIGSSALWIDDDGTFDLSSSGTTNHVTISSDPQSPAYKIYSNINNCIQANPKTSINVLNEFNIILGHSPQSLINGKSWNVNQLRYDDQCSLQDPISKCKIVLGGLYGDSGMGLSNWMLFLEDENWKSEFSSRSDWKIKSQSRVIKKYHSHIALSPCSNLMAGFMATDLSDTVAPFFPYFRNEDGLFGLMTKFFEPQALMAQVPINFLHLPAESRAYNSDSLFPNHQENWPDNVISAILQQLNLPPSSLRSERVNLLSQYLKKYSQLSDTKFHSLLSELKFIQISAELNRLENLKENPYKKIAIQEIEVIEKHLQKSLLSSGSIVPEIVGMKDFKDLLFQFSQTLEHWDSITEHSKSSSLHKSP